MVILCQSQRKNCLYKECIMPRHTMKKTKGAEMGGKKKKKPIKKMMGGGSKMTKGYAKGGAKMTKGYARGGAKVGRKK